MNGTPAPDPARARGFRPAWLALLVACGAAVTAADALLLAVATGFLTTGYNSAHLDSPGALALFLLASVPLDLMLVLALWLVLIPVLVALRAGRLQVLVAAGLVATGVPMALAAARYDLYSTVGGMFSLALLRQFSRESSSSMVVEAVGSVPMVAGVALALVGAVLVGHVSARRIERAGGGLDARFEPPGPRALALGVLASGLLGVVALSLASPAFRFGFDRKPSAELLTALVERVSDVDGDGFGLLSRPPDAEPFDASIHPYATDLPGNGIDENGVAGDHPPGFRPQQPVQAGTGPVESRPHLLLIYLESFRGDLIGQRLGGREITPFMNRLAREGASTAQAWVHSPWTLASRAQLFGGRLLNRPGERTLVDDFRERGYRVALFSGQDDSFGNSVELIGAERADVFYDARRDVARRTSRSTASVSLQVSWKTLAERVGDFIAEMDPEQPVFLYVNVVDTHFPYVHGELDAILDVEPLTRSGIRADRARQVFEAYANTAANVDRAVERIVGAFRARIGEADHAILVTADHGQSFYEDGYLGHGQALDDAQTRVPFIVWGIGGDWPEPIAPSDVRGLLMRHLAQDRADGPPRARFVPAPGRRVFQYVSSLERPRAVALRGVDGALRYDFRSERLERVGPDGAPHALSPEEQRARLPALIHTWEALQLEAERHGT